MGFPVVDAVANEFGVQPLSPETLPNPHASIGLSMCVPNVATVVLTALCCIDLSEAKFGVPAV